MIRVGYPTKYLIKYEKQKSTSHKIYEKQCVVLFYESFIFELDPLEKLCHHAPGPMKAITKIPCENIWLFKFQILQTRTFFFLYFISKPLNFLQIKTTCSIHFTAFRKISLAKSSFFFLYCIFDE